MFSCQLFDDEGEEQTDDRSHDLADVGAGLFCLELSIFEEEGFELGVLLFWFGGLRFNLGHVLIFLIDFILDLIRWFRLNI